jgi:phospholipid-binding lipoprotein MlaA
LAGALLLAGLLPVGGRALAGDPAAARPVADLDGEEPEAPRVWDPMEGMNRGTLRANLAINRWILDPVIGAYAFVVPAPARRAVRRALVNLHSPAVFANDVLQIAPVDAGVTLARFVVNTTLGLVGLFDPATGMGLPGHHTDFGQTLALYGMPSGPYLILPVLGPTTVRDGSGYLVDFLFQPTTYVLPGLTLFVYTGIHQGSVGLVELEEHADQLQALQASSVDFYAALRSAYVQDRAAAIEARRDRGRSVIAAR